MIQTRSDQYWIDLKAKDLPKYKAEKQAVADAVIENLEAEYPGIKSAIEVVDVSTPSTITRYTGNWKSSFEGFLPTRETMQLNLGNTLPNLKSFYMLGQWTTPGGGLPPAGMGGRAVAAMICKQDKKKFVARED